MARGNVKAEPSSSKPRRRNAEAAEAEHGDEANANGSDHEAVTGRRVLRSRYLAMKSLICDEREGITRPDSEKFNSIINEVESLHQLVQKPREQVADAEALFDITSTLVASVKAHGNEGITASDFVTALLRDFGRQDGASSSAENGSSSVCWRKLGHAVSDVFMKAPGCSTMLGPMNTEIKQRKAHVQRKRVRPTENSRPEELDSTGSEEKTDTDKNMAIMFDILRKNRRVRLESLVLNRNCFAQTVENVFALSFLVKDGRAQITINDKGWHIVGPRNAPAANAVVSGEVSYTHFVFRFDFSDWKLMGDSIAPGEELMPNRVFETTTRNETEPPEASSPPPEEETRQTGPTTPIRKFSRNRGLVLQEQTVVQDSPESDDSAAREASLRTRRRRKLR